MTLEPGKTHGCSAFGNQASPETAVREASVRETGDCPHPSQASGGSLVLRTDVQEHEPRACSTKAGLSTSGFSVTHPSSELLLEALDSENVRTRKDDLKHVSFVPP